VAVLKLSQIAASPSNFAATDTLVGVRTANTDLQFSFAQIAAGVASGVVGGSNGQLQFNNAGAFGGIAGSFFNGSDLALTGGALALPGSAMQQIQGISSLFQVLSDSAPFGWSQITYDAGQFSSGMAMAKTRATVVGSHAAVQQNDVLPEFDFYGDDGTNFQEAGAFRCLVDASVSAGIVPGRFEFSTANSAGGLIEALRIDHNQLVSVAGGIVGLGGTAPPQISGINGAVNILSNPSIAGAPGWGQIQIAYSNVAGNDLGIAMVHTRSTSVGTFAINSSGDLLGEMDFYGDDGTAFQRAAGIFSLVDGAPAAGSMPGRLTFETTPSGSVSAVERIRIDSTGNSLFNMGGGSGSFGYGTGSGGTVTQATSKSTGVTLSKQNGQITMNNANLAASTTVTFTLTNSIIAATDIVLVQHTSAGTAGAYTFTSQPAAGSVAISVRNVSLGALAEAIVLTFAVIRSVTS
jgi:hypothetical protein